MAGNPKKDQTLTYTIQADENQLNNLFRELLDGCRDDLTEAERNVELYFEEVTKSSDNKLLYGSLYNDSLKIKGTTRQRLLALLNMFKERVSTKERMDIETGKHNQPGKTNLTPEFMNQQIEEMMKSKETVKPVISKEEQPEEDNSEIFVPNFEPKEEIPPQTLRGDIKAAEDDYEVDEEYVEGDEDFEEDDLE